MFIGVSNDLALAECHSQQHHIAVSFPCTETSMVSVVLNVSVSLQ